MEKKTPAVPFARDLESAGPRTFVHVDRTGQVRSPMRYRVLTALTWASAVASVGGVTLLYGIRFGAPGLIAGAAMLAWIGWRVRPALAVRRALRHIVADELDAAEAIVQTVLERPAPSGARAMARHYQGAIATLRGDYPAALQHHRSALGQLAMRSRRRITTRIIEYAEVLALVNVGQATEARRLLGTRHPGVPRGDYLRFVHWTTELYIGLAEGKTDLSEDELHERARAALRINTSAGLLGLLAWAHIQIGADDQAFHLLRESYERLPGTHIVRTLPLLHTWMEAHRAEADAEASRVTRTASLLL